jgi:copper homeostasis protein
MAFDDIEGDVENKLNSIKILNNIGVNRILTKGCKTRAPDGIEDLKKYNNYAQSINENFIIMPGGGVTNSNYKLISELTGCKELHGTKIVGEL